MGVALFIFVQEAFTVLGANVPPGANEEPAALWQGSVLRLPFADVVVIQQEVGVGGGLCGDVQDKGWAY